ncbi:MAG: hypothetical protein ACYDIA_00620 [Candidatus Humimicrobiaceae bacterium]
MINLVFCIKSRESFKRITNTLKIDNNFELEDFTPNLETLQENIIIKDYDIAIVDEKLTWQDAALDLLNKKSVKIVLFKGDFKKTISDIYSKISKDKSNLGKTQKENRVQFAGSPRDKIYYTKNESAPIKEATPVKNIIYKALENKLIVIGGLSRGAGSTFLSVNLAKALTDLKIRTSIIEPPLDEPYLFYYLGIDKALSIKCMENNFYSYPHAIDNGQKIIKNMGTIIDDIIWIMPSPFENKIESWDHIKMLMLLDVARRSPINIIDVGTNYEHESIESILSGADMFLIAVNPLPAELNKNKGKIENLLKLKKEGLPIEFVINYHTPAITKRALSEYFKTTPVIYIPVVETRYIQECAYKYKIPITHPQVSEKLFAPISEIIKNIIPLDILKETIKNQSLNDENIIYRIKEKIAGLKSVFTGIKF